MSFSNLSKSSDREKKLLIIAGIMLIVIVLPMLYSMYSGTSGVFARRNALREKVAELERTVERGRLYARRLDEYAAKSLPPRGDQARDWYKKWLLDQAVKSGFQNVKVENLSSSKPNKKNPEIQNFSFRLTGESSLHGLTDLLYDFYGAQHAQLIKTLTLRALEESNKLSVSMDIESFSLDREKHNKGFEMNPISDSAKLEYLRALAQEVNNRALFSAYSPPPGEGPPPAPPQETQQKFTDAMYTYISAVVEINGKYQVWIDRRLKGDQLRLFIGDHIDVNGYDCIIREIDLRKIVIETKVENEEDGSLMDDVQFTIRVGRCIDDFEEEEEEGGV